MANVTLYLDKRSLKKDGTAPVKLVIGRRSKSTMISTNVSVLPNQWDSKTNSVVNHPQKKLLNTFLQRQLVNAQMELIRLGGEGILAGMSMKEIREHYLTFFNYKTKEEKPVDLFLPRFLRFLASKNNERTREIYSATLGRIRQYESNIEALTFPDINKDWLTDFDKFLSRTSPSVNARAIHFRNIRAVFNDAIDDEIITCYPFRKFKIRRTETRKRSLSAEDLRKLFSYPVEDFQKRYVDLFKLSFLLIGINIGDLCKLREVKDGRVDYIRAKTHKLYSVKVEPEAMEIINRYKGEEYLLDVLNTYSNYRDFAKRMNGALQSIGNTEIGKHGKKTFHPVWKELTTYWARHSWATIAAELEVPKETIAAALGHGGNTVTDIYIDFDRKKVDEANRKVINWVLYEKL